MYKFINVVGFFLNKCNFLGLGKGCEPMAMNFTEKEKNELVLLAGCYITVILLHIKHLCDGRRHVGAGSDVWSVEGPTFAQAVR